MMLSQQLTYLTLYYYLVSLDPCPHDDVGCLVNPVSADDWLLFVANESYLMLLDFVSFDWHCLHLNYCHCYYYYL